MEQKIFSIDLGSKLLKICVGEENKQGNINILTKLSKNIDSFKNGEIIDYELFPEEVIEPLIEIGNQIGEIPQNVIVSFSSSLFIPQRARGKVSVNEKYITEEELKRVHLMAKASITSSSYEILFEEPTSYFIDNTTLKIREPLGVEAKNIEVDFFVIQYLRSTINKLKEVFNENGIKISSILPNPVPASYILFQKKEKENGVMLIDFGYRVLTVLIFQESRIAYYKSLGFGVGDIIEDLSMDLGLESTKINSLLEELNGFTDEEKKKFKVKLGKDKLNYRNLTKLIEKKIINYWKKNNINDIFHKIKENYKIPYGIYLIGGGCYLPEIKEIFKKQINHQIKIETDFLKILSPKEILFINSAGLIYSYYRFIQRRSIWNSLKNFFLDLLK